MVVAVLLAILAVDLIIENRKNPEFWAEVVFGVTLFGFIWFCFSRA